MTPPARRAAAPLAAVLPPWSWAVGAMISIQAAVALSIPLTQKLGAPAAVCLRLCFAAIMLLLLARPWAAIARLRAGEGRSALLLGVVTGTMTSCYFASVAHIPIGMANAIEFLGPLGVALWQGRRLRDAALAVFAASGVALLLLPGLQAPPHATSGLWHVNLTGVALASAAAFFWALYIVLTKRVGTQFAGIDGLAISITVAACVTLPGAIASGGLWHADLHDLRWLVLMALMTPVLPFALEVAALRQMDAGRFGLLMSVELAVALFFGVVLLHQTPSLLQAIGFACVIAVNALAALGPAASQESGPHAE